MPNPPTIDPARRRRRAIIAASVMLVVVAFAAVDAVLPHRDALRAVDIVRITALIVLALVLALRSTSNFTFAKRNPELDDELTRANRASAAFIGFWAMLLAAVGAYISSFLLDLTLTEAAPMIMGIGAVAAGARFAFLEAAGEGIV